MRSLILVVFLALGISAQAQVNHIGRFETAHTNNNKNYLLISNEEYGATLFMLKFKETDRKYPIDVQFFDSELNPVWQETMNVPNTYFQRGYFPKGAHTYLLFQNRAKEHLLRFYKVDPIKKEIKEWETNKFIDFNITQFKVLQNTAVVAGYYRERPAVFTYDMESDEIRPIGDVFQNNSELLEIKVNRDSLTFNVLTTQLNNRKERTAVVNTFDYKGNVVRGYGLKMPEGHQVLNAVSSSIKDREQVVAGVYSNKANMAPTGIFINHVNSTAQQSIQFMNFGEFDTFLDHWGDNSEKLKAQARKASRSDKSWKLNVDGLLRPFIETDGKLVFSGEFFQTFGPNALNFQRLNFWQREMTGLTDQQVLEQLLWQGPFDSFIQPSIFMDPRDLARLNFPKEINYSHSFALGIDYKGNVLWEGSTEIDEVIDTKGEPTHHLGDFLITDNKAYYGYYQDEFFKTKVISDGSAGVDVSYPIDLLNEDEEIVWERDYTTGLIRWHKDKFLAYGIQHVKDDKKRIVYFINAVSVEPGLISAGKN